MRRTWSSSVIGLSTMTVIGDGVAVLDQRRHVEPDAAVENVGSPGEGPDRLLEARTGNGPARQADRQQGGHAGPNKLPPSDQSLHEFEAVFVHDHPFSVVR